VTTEQMRERLSELRTQGHERCVVCAPSHPLGLRIEYHVAAGGVVHAEFMCDDLFQGYRGQLHGGVITSLLDGAMTNCLFAHGIEAVTAELTVRFLRPVLTDRVAVVSARLSKSSRRLYVLEAELIQEQMAVARARGKFLNRPMGVQHVPV
jgi:uncharacterized protein (TIGR00369 family)